VWRTRTQLELAVVEYVAWFNTVRLHTSIGMRPPAEHEADWRRSPHNRTASCRGSAVHRETLLVYDPSGSSPIFGSETLTQQSKQQRPTNTSRQTQGTPDPATRLAARKMHHGATDATPRPRTGHRRRSSATSSSRPRNATELRHRRHGPPAPPGALHLAGVGIEPLAGDLSSSWSSPLRCSQGASQAPWFERPARTRAALS